MQMTPAARRDAHRQSQRRAAPLTIGDDAAADAAASRAANRVADTAAPCRRSSSSSCSRSSPSSRSAGRSRAAADSAAAIRRACSRVRRSTSSFRRCSFAPARASTSRASTPRVLLGFFVPTVALLAVVYAVLRFGRREQAAQAPAGPSVRAITSVFGNSVQIGIPLAAALYGESGLALHVTIVSLHSLTLLTILTALVELDLAHARRRADPGASHLFGTLATTARNTVIHPVVLPVLAGLAWNAVGAGAARSSPTKSWRRSARPWCRSASS